MLVYLTAHDIFEPGFDDSLDAIITEVRHVPLEFALSWCAAWVGELERPDKDRFEVDREFVEASYREPLKSRVLHLLERPGRVLLAPQALVVLAKLAIEHCGREGRMLDSSDPGPLLRAMLLIADRLEDDVKDLAEDELVVDVDGGRMARYMVANQLFNNPANWRAAWAITHRCLRELPNELKDHPRVLDFHEAYVAATGASLDDVSAVCALLWSSSITGHPTLSISQLSSLRWETERLDGVLDLIASSPETLRTLLREEADELGVWWSTRTFDRFPIVRWSEHLTVLRPAWVVNRSTGEWPLMDIRRTLGERGETSTGNRVAGSVRHAYEHFAVEAIEDAAAGGTVYRDNDVRAAYGKQGKVADAAVDFGSSWIVFEVTARGFQLKTAAGVSDDALGQDLDDIVLKAKQAQATIDNIRANPSALTGKQSWPDPGDARWRFYPVVVIGSRFAGNPLTFTMLRARLRDEGVLQAEDCAPLEVLELEDLLALEGACEHHGYSFLDTLASKALVESPLLPMQEYLSARIGHPATQPARIERAWPTWIDTAISQLEPDQAE